MHRTADQDVERLQSSLRSLLTRRDVLRAMVMAGGLVGLSPLLAACGGDDGTNTEDAGDDPTEPPAGGDAETQDSEEDQNDEDADQGDQEAQEDQDEAGRGGRLVHVRSSDSDSLDPQRTIASASWFVFSNIFDTLISKNMDLEFEPLVAESWEVSDDGLEYTFTIRDGLTFHDGGAVTAEAVKFTFDRATDPDAPATAISFIDAYESSELIDENTVLLRLSEPSAPFVSNIAVAYFGILSPEGVETHGQEFGKNPVGSGPWMFEEWSEGEQITLVPFPDYVNHRSYVENKGAPLADELVFRVIPEAGTQIAAIETGEANHFTLPKTEVRNFQDDSNYNLFYSDGGTNIFYIEFAMEQQEEWGEPEFLPPFDDLRVRQAVAYAVNPEEFIATILEGIGDRNFGYMPTGLFAYDPAIEEFGYHHDLDRANELLDEAGWTLDGDVRSKDGESLELTMWAWTDPTYERVVQVLQAQLAEIGMQINIEVLEVGTMLARLGENQHDLNLMGYGWPEADILYVMADSDWGLGYYQPPEYMELISQARQTIDLDERRELYFEAQQVALADVMAVPLWTDVTIVLTRAEVKGFRLGPDAINVWVDAWVES